MIPFATVLEEMRSNCSEEEFLFHARNYHSDNLGQNPSSGYMVGCLVSVWDDSRNCEELLRYLGIDDEAQGMGRFVDPDSNRILVLPLAGAYVNSTES